MTGYRSKKDMAQDRVNYGASSNYPPQPAQKPVAWGVFEGNLHDMFFTEAEAVEMAQLKGTHAEVKPLYTKEKNNAA